MICLSVEKDEGDEFTKPYQRISIEELYCDKQYSNTAVEDKLLIKAESWAQSKRINDLTLIVYSHKKNLIKLYKKTDINRLVLE